MGLDGIAVTAWPASGKSVAARNVIKELQEHNLTVHFFSDKEALLDQVAYEIQKSGQSLGSPHAIETPNFTLVNPAENRLSWGIKFKHASTLNDAHRRLFESVAMDLATKSRDTRLVVELAYGENAQYPDGPLRQNMSDFLTQMEQYGILHRMGFLDVYARLRYRRPRNKGRINEVGYIPDAEFVKYFKDEGGWTRADERRVDRSFFRIRNEGITRDHYEQVIRDKATAIIVPWLRGEGAGRSMEQVQYRRKER